MAYVHSIVEGTIDEAVSIRLISETGHIPGTVYGKHGSGYIRKKIAAFNQSAHGINYLALVDLMDTGMDCAPLAVNNWLPHPNAGMTFRIVVREIESWLMADRDGIAELLAIKTNKVPQLPEMEPDPKLTLVNLARRSRLKSVKNAFVPQINSSAETGRLYVSEMSKFAQTKWNIARARANSPSLDRCIHKLASLHI